MGVVYKAEDTKLGRLVALKFLPEALAQDRQALERFQREARAASALNHPNICTIYDIDEFEGRPFIAMELLEGQTLRERIAKPLTPGPSPQGRGEEENGFPSPPGRGWSRGAGPGEGALPHETPTASIDPEHLTSPGTALGTVAYMSPEQARCEPVDARTDLFSFGAVLYEMATGRRAFDGATTAVIFHQILAQVPDPPLKFNPSLPAKLEEIVNKALEKDRDLRYHSAGDLRADLKRLKRDTDSGRSAVEAGPLTPTEVLPSPPGRGCPDVVGTGEGAQRWPLALARLLALIAASGLVWFLTHRAPPPQPSGELTQKRLTFNSSDNPVDSGAISPDGKYLAYSDPAGIHVKLLSTGEERLISKPTGLPPGANWVVASWFPDGTQLLADTWQPGGHGSIWTVSVLGQSPRELREGAGAWEVSPDGTRIAFSPEPGASGDIREIWVMGSQGDNPQKVLALGENEALDNVHWSPDGKRLAYTSKPRTAGDWFHAVIETCDLTGVKRTVVVSYERAWLDDYCWLPDGRIVYSREEPPGSWDGNVWQIGIDGQAGTPTGKPKRITQWAGSLIKRLERLCGWEATGAPKGDV